MKKNALALGMIAALALFAGCDNSNKPTPPTNNPPATPQAEPAKAAGAAASAVDSAKAAVEKTVTDTKAAVTTTANPAAADANTKFNSLVDQAKSLLGQNKYTEALNSLQQLSSLKLTPEQEKIVSDLKAQIEKAMAGKTASEAVGNLLKK